MAQDDSCKHKSVMLAPMKADCASSVSAVRLSHEQYQQERYWLLVCIRQILNVGTLCSQWHNHHAVKLEESDNLVAALCWQLSGKTCLWASI